MNDIIDINKISEIYKLLAFQSTEHPLISILSTFDYRNVEIPNGKYRMNLYMIEQAKTKLLGSDSSVSEIAFDFGFEYPQHFSKLFKSKTGYSPSEYRNMN